MSVKLEYECSKGIGMMDSTCGACRCCCCYQGGQVNPGCQAGCHQGLLLCTAQRIQLCVPTQRSHVKHTTHITHCLSSVNLPAYVHEIWSKSSRVSRVLGGICHADEIRLGHPCRQQALLSLSVCDLSVCRWSVCRSVCRSVCWSACLSDKCRVVVQYMVVYQLLMAVASYSFHAFDGCEFSIVQVCCTLLKVSVSVCVCLSMYVCVCACVCVCVCVCLPFKAFPELVLCAQCAIAQVCDAQCSFLRRVQSCPILLSLGKRQQDDHSSADMPHNDHHTVQDDCGRASQPLNMHALLPYTQKAYTGQSV